MKNQKILSFLIPLLVAVVATGCKSFDESVKAITTPQAPPGYVPPTYITGTREVSSVDPSKLELKVYRIDSDTYPDSIRLYASVSDGAGNLVTNLAPPYYNGHDDYRKIWSGLTERIGDNGPISDITQFAVREFSDKDGIPYEIAMVLDYSGSLRSNLKQLEDAAAGFIKLKRSQDRIALVKFDQKPRIAVPPTSSESELLAAFGKGQDEYGGYTALYQAAKLGGDQIMDAPSGNPRALVVFTDGEDNASNITSYDLFQFNRQQNIPVFVIAMGAINVEALTDVAEYTGGKFYQTYTPDELRGAFEDIYRNLRNYYLITYKPVRGVGKHIVNVSLNPPGATQRVAAQGEYNTLKRDMMIANDEPILLPDIYFDYDKATLRPESDVVIDQIAELMRENPRLKIEIQGHTDSNGGEDYNQTLSDARATAVTQTLIRKGIDGKRLRARGFGLSQPKATNQTEEGRQQNRRTEFVVLAR
jgi:VWFA-related protein